MAALPADPQRGHHRRAGAPAHRRGRRGDRVRRGGDQPAHPADGPLRRPDRAAPAVRARARVSRPGGGRCTRAPGRTRRCRRGWPAWPALYGLPVGTCCATTSARPPRCRMIPRRPDLDWDPPADVLAALGERTGAGLGELRRMTIAGWVPWLLDTLDGRWPGGVRHLRPAALGAASARAKPDAAPSRGGGPGYLNGRRAQRAGSARCARPIQTTARPWRRGCRS